MKKLIVILALLISVTSFGQQSLDVIKWDRHYPNNNNRTWPLLVVDSYSSVILYNPQQTTPLTFTQIPFSNPDFLAPGRGAEHWFDGYAVDVPAGNTTGLDFYMRINWAQIELANGGYNWTTFDNNVRSAINRGLKVHFGILCMAEGYFPAVYGSPGGAGLSYPVYLHNQMQAENPKDWITDGIWVPNWNSPSYLNALDKLNKGVAAHIATTSYTPNSGPWAGQSVPFSKVIGIIDIRGYGNFGEWHVAPWYGRQPQGTNATSATLKRIIDIHKDAFPNNQLVMIMNAIDNGGSTQVPADVAYHVLTQKNNVGRFGLRRDNWGQKTFDGILMTNSMTYNGVSIQSLINEIWKTAPWTGEPSASQTHTTFNGVPYSDLPASIAKYHASSFGNGNWCGGCTGNAAMRDAVRAASKTSGYRLAPESGSVSSVLSAGAPFQIVLNWKNSGIAPVYENWNVIFELRNSSNVAVWSGTSSFKVRHFLPGSASNTDNFTLGAVPSGTYNLVMIIRDPVGYRKPLPLAINGRASDGSYPLKSVTVGSGGPVVNQSPISNAGANQTITLPVSTATLTGSGTDADGTISAYNWVKVSGPVGGTITNMNAASTGITSLNEGTYIYRLTVTDNKAAGSSASVSVTVKPGVIIPPVRVVVFKFNFFFEGKEFELIIYSDDTAETKKK